jgi:cell division protein FtsA
MTKSLDRNLIVGLDIGTSRIKAVIGEITPDQQLSIVGVGNQLARGMDKGGVNDLNLVVNSVQQAVAEAEAQANCSVSSVYLVITGKHIKCQNESGMVPISDTEVTQDDVDSVIHAAKSVPISAERRLLHVIPQEFTVDTQEGIKSPIGMSGVRMSAKAHIITCGNDMARNIEKCVERCGLHVDQLIFSSLASSYAVLTDDEKDLGVCLIDMGGGTLDISVFTNGALRHSAVVPVAGNQVTSDIAKIFRTPVGHAEDIKIKYACAMQQWVGTEEQIEVPSVGGRAARTMSRHTLTEVVEPRFRELFELVLAELRRSGLLEQIAAGIVITGGTAKMAGAVECAEDIFQMPVRLGYPAQVTGLKQQVSDPAYASVVGLLLYGKEMRQQQQNAVASRESVGGIVRKITNWFKREF